MRTTVGAGVLFFVFAFCSVAVAAQPITVEQAEKIALAQTGVGGMVVETDIDNRRGGGVTYEFEIIADDTKFEIEIDGATGDVTEFSREKERRSAAPTKLTSEAAQKLAVDEAGGGSAARYKLDRDNGRLVHEITILRDDRRYRLEIDDATGEVGELSIKQLKK